MLAPPAADAQSNGGAPVNWLVNCSNIGADGDLICNMSQSVVARETGRRLVTVSFRKGETPEAPATMLTSP